MVDISVGPVFPEADFNQFNHFNQAPDESGSSEQWFHLLGTAPGSPC
jgi:hypothetical protein